MWKPRARRNRSGGGADVLPARQGHGACRGRHRRTGRQNTLVTLASAGAPQPVGPPQPRRSPGRHPSEDCLASSGGSRSARRESRQPTQVGRVDDDSPACCGRGRGRLIGRWVLAVGPTPGRGEVPGPASIVCSTLSIGKTNRGCPDTMPSLSASPLVGDRPELAPAMTVLPPIHSAAVVSVPETREAAHPGSLGRNRSFGPRAVRRTNGRRQNGFGFGGLGIECGHGHCRPSASGGCDVGAAVGRLKLP